MDKQKDNQNPADELSQRSGYATPGKDDVIESRSLAVGSPGEPSEQRLQGPKPTIESISETPGDSNPALSETVGAEEGQTSTADLLRARETAEEQNLRGTSRQMYADQLPGSNPQAFEHTDAGRPNWPDDLQEDPMEYRESPRAYSSITTGVEPIDATTMQGRVDAVSDRAGAEAAARESGSGLAPVGYDAAEDEYERREMHTPTQLSDLDLIAPDMLNIPPDDDDV
jgi:hypothetical protein